MKNKLTIVLLFISTCLYSQVSKSPLEGKKIVTIGNSITAACGYQPYLVDWPGVKWSKDETWQGMDGHSPMAIGGTIVRPTNAKSIFYRSFDANYYNPDIILVYGCQNDNQKDKWGTISDAPYLQHQVCDSVTLASAFMGMVECLVRDNPNAKIYLITLMRVKATVGMNPVKMYENKYKHPRFETFQEVLDWEKTMRYPKVELVRKIGKKYNLAVIDLYENSGVNNNNADIYYGSIADDCTQVHPNDIGYKRMAECIASVLDPNFKIPLRQVDFLKNVSSDVKTWRKIVSDKVIYSLYAFCTPGAKTSFLCSHAVNILPNKV